MSNNNFGKDIEDFTSTNRVPEEWWKEGFLTENQTLYDFFINFMLKLEYRENLYNSLFIYDKILIDLGRMFDPFSFFISSLTEYSMKNQVFYLFIKLKSSFKTII